MTMRWTASLLLGAAALAGCSANATNPKDAENTEARRSGNQPQQDSTRLEMPPYPSPETWQHASERQRQRAARSFEQLKRRKVPVYQGPLMVEDDEEATLQSPQDVARRTLVLWAVELRAEGVAQEETLAIINRLDLWGSVSPEEERFLRDPDPDSEECERLVWRLESISVLLWALGYIDRLEWPNRMTDGAKIAKILAPREDNPEFITGAKLRSKAEILDAQDLMMRTHWAIRDALLHRGGMIPEDLDWSQDEDWIPVTMSAAVGIVEQRHYVLNWLVKFLDPEDWDHVDTPT